MPTPEVRTFKKPQVLTFESPVVFTALVYGGEQYEETTVPQEVFEALMEAVGDSMDAYFQGGLAVWGGPADDIIVSVAYDYQRGTVKAITGVRMSNDDPGAIEELKNYITGQFSDGWGEGFEQREFYEDNEDTKWFAHFWNNENWYLKQV